MFVARLRHSAKAGPSNRPPFCRNGAAISPTRNKEIATVADGSLGAKTEPTQKVEKIYIPVKTKKTEFLSGPPKEVAAKLVEKLRFESRVI